MSTRAKTPKTAATPKTTVLVRMPPELVAILDSEVERRRAFELPGAKISRSSVLRDLVRNLDV